MSIQNQPFWTTQDQKSRDPNRGRRTGSIIDKPVPIDSNGFENILKFWDSNSSSTINNLPKSPKFESASESPILRRDPTPASPLNFNNEQNQDEEYNLSPRGDIQLQNLPEKTKTTNIWNNRTKRKEKNEANTRQKQRPVDYGLNTQDYLAFPFPNAISPIKTPIKDFNADMPMQQPVKPVSPLPLRQNMPIPPAKPEDAEQKPLKISSPSIRETESPRRHFPPDSPSHSPSPPQHNSIPRRILVQRKNSPSSSENSPPTKSDRSILLNPISQKRQSFFNRQSLPMSRMRLGSEIADASPVRSNFAVPTSREFNNPIRGIFANTVKEYTPEEDDEKPLDFEFKVSKPTKVDPVKFSTSGLSPVKVNTAKRFTQQNREKKESFFARKTTKFLSSSSDDEEDDKRFFNHEEDINEKPTDNYNENNNYDNDNNQLISSMEAKRPEIFQSNNNNNNNSNRESFFAPARPFSILKRSQEEPTINENQEEPIINQNQEEEEQIINKEEPITNKIQEQPVISNEIVLQKPEQIVSIEPEETKPEKVEEEIPKFISEDTEVSATPVRERPLIERIFKTPIPETTTSSPPKQPYKSRFSSRLSRVNNIPSSSSSSSASDSGSHTPKKFQRPASALLQSSPFSDRLSQKLAQIQAAASKGSQDQKPDADNDKIADKENEEKEVVVQTQKRQLTRWNTRAGFSTRLHKSSLDLDDTGSLVVAPSPYTPTKINLTLAPSPTQSTRVDEDDAIAFGVPSDSPVAEKESTRLLHVSDDEAEGVKIATDDNKGVIDTGIAEFMDTGDIPDLSDTEPQSPAPSVGGNTVFNSVQVSSNVVNNQTNGEVPFGEHHVEPSPVVHRKPRVRKPVNKASYFISRRPDVGTAGDGYTLYMGTKCPRTGVTEIVYINAGSKYEFISRTAHLLMYIQQGTGKITCNDQSWMVAQGGHGFLGKGAFCELENNGEDDLVVFVDPQ